MKHPVAFIGSNCIDEYYSIDSVPQLGDKVLCRYLDSKIGGMIGNAASVYAGFGNTTYMLDFMNLNHINQILLDDLVQSNINIDYIYFDETYPDSKCMIMLKDGERIIYIMDNSKIIHRLNPEQIDCLKECEYVYTSLGDLIQIENYPEVIKTIHEHNTKLVIDVEKNSLSLSNDLLNDLSFASILFINEQAHEVLQDKIGDEYVNTLVKQDCLLVFTQAERGSTVYSKDSKIHIPAYKVNVNDTTGAGDTYNVSFLHRLNQGYVYYDCGLFASAAAALCITEIGARSGVNNEDKVLIFMKSGTLLEN